MSSRISDYDSFRQAVYEAATDDSKFKNFLRHPEILKIFGHYKYENALKIWDKMSENIVSSSYFDNSLHCSFYNQDMNSLSLLPDYDYLDRFEYKPKESQFRDYFNLHSFCLEFIRVALDIQDKLNLDYLYYYQIVELGVGFLGQYMTFAGKFGKYYMIDLPEVLLLADKIIKKKSEYFNWEETDILHGWFNTEKISTFDLNRYPFHTKELDTNGIFFSSHAFSELTREHQLNVYENVIRHCKSGYILMNQISHLHGVDSMNQDEHKSKLDELGKRDIEVHEEWPLTFKGNYVLTWADSS